MVFNAGTLAETEPLIPGTFRLFRTAGFLSGLGSSLPMRLWKIAYAATVCALLAYALSRYPEAVARYADLWSGVRVNLLDSRLLRPALLYSIERSGSELRVLLLRTYAEPAAHSMAVKLTVYNVDGSECIFILGERAPPGRLVAFAVHAPMAAGLRVVIEVDSARVVEERWLGNP